MSAPFVGVGGVHDVGGAHIDGAIEPVDHSSLTYWERSIHAVLVLLASQKPPLLTTDELRRGVESLELKAYESWGDFVGYFEE